MLSGNDIDDSASRQPLLGLPFESRHGPQSTGELELTADMRPRFKISLVFVLGFLIGLSLLIGVLRWSMPEQEEIPLPPTIAVASISTDGVAPTRARGDAFAVRITRPSGPLAVEVIDEHGRMAEVTCVVCHSLRAPSARPTTHADLDTFHHEMVFDHGALSCQSCHNSADYGTFRLADQQVVENFDVMTLCSQCHGPQFRDYVHGAHGGMNGYWDLERGPRERNSCVVCHDPHAPAFPSMLPTFKPFDRFLASPDHEMEHVDD